MEKIFPKHAFDDYEDLDEWTWINQRFEQFEANSISCGLQKTIFSYEKHKDKNRPIIPVVRHPKKKTQEKLWSDLLGESVSNLMITYSDV